MKKLITTFALSLAMTGGATAAASAQECPVDHTIEFAVSNWDSVAFHTEVARKIIEEGWGCETEAVSADTLPAITGLANGDLHVYMEVWVANAEKPWVEAREKGQVVDLGVNFPDAPQGWFVPEYLVEGEDAPAPDLETPQDLVKYKDLFSDPEEPEKGRFYNCVPGWGCERTNTKKLAVYGLDEHFTNYRPGSGGAFAAEIYSAIQREEPIVFYYWGPSSLYGKIADRIVMLEEAPYDEETWSKLQNQENPTEATAYPNAPVHKGANAEFAESAPAIIGFLENYNMSTEETSQVLAYMDDNQADADEAAVWWLQNNEEWKDWVPAEVAERVSASL